MSGPGVDAGDGPHGTDGDGSDGLSDTGADVGIALALGPFALGLHATDRRLSTLPRGSGLPAVRLRRGSAGYGPSRPKVAKTLG
ncbi:hypothetical protein FHS23_000982 [Prauserella isguenensis]|uniref:Uncharacterized protein n=1 Tax=Prauserella isguenensis TaxID=1470180 RepID=A0A839RZR4_9PSEU|nr:hypothetical protein [Prauserella isguenensis]